MPGTACPFCQLCFAMLMQGIKAVSTVSVQFDLGMLTSLRSAKQNKAIPIKKLAAHARPFSEEEVRHQHPLNQFLS
jgi:hypothetical protein